MQPTEAELGKGGIRHPAPPHVLNHRDTSLRNPKCRSLYNTHFQARQKQLSLQAVAGREFYSETSIFFSVTIQNRQEGGWGRESILEMSQIFLASVSWKFIQVPAAQTGCLLCVQTRDKPRFFLPAASALTPGHFHYSSLWLFFL